MSILTQELISWYHSNSVQDFSVRNGYLGRYLRPIHLSIWSTRPGRQLAGLGQVMAKRRVSMVRVMVMVRQVRGDWTQDVLAPGSWLH